MILTAHGLSIAVTSPVVGWLIDRWGVRVPLAGGLLLYGVAGGAGAFLSSYPALIATRIAFGVGAAAVFAGTTVALLSYYQGAQRDTVMGWRSTAISLGGVVWPLLAGAIGGLSWHAPSPSTSSASRWACSRCWPCPAPIRPPPRTAPTTAVSASCPC